MIGYNKSIELQVSLSSYYNIHVKIFLILTYNIQSIHNLVRHFDNIGFLGKLELIIKDFRKRLDDGNKFVLFGNLIPNFSSISEYHHLELGTRAIFVIYYTSTYRAWKTTLINEDGISMVNRSTDNPTFIPWEIISNIELSDNYEISFKIINSDKINKINKLFFSINGELVLNIIPVLNKLVRTVRESKNNSAPILKYFSEFESPIENFDEWMKESFDYVHIGENIFQYYDNNSILKFHKAKASGYLDIIDKSPNVLFIKNKIIYKIYECNNIDQLLSNYNIFINEPEVFFDRFTQTKNISWKRVSSYLLKTNAIKLLSNDNKIQINLGFYYDNGDYIVFEFSPIELNLQKNDSIEILFKSDLRIKFIAQNKLIKSKNDEGEKIVRFKNKITISELISFGSIEIESIKITRKMTDNSVFFGEKGGDPYYKNKKSLSLAILNYARNYREVVLKEIPNHKPLELRDGYDNTKKRINNEECYVYIMKDITNNFYKIGVSNKPEYRENTLQSEKPTIELLEAKRFPIRKIAVSFEKALHESFSDQRIRGEWFKLSNEDVNNIILSLK